MKMIDYIELAAYLFIGALVLASGFLSIVLYELYIRAWVLSAWAWLTP